MEELSQSTDVPVGITEGITERLKASLLDESTGVG